MSSLTQTVNTIKRDEFEQFQFAAYEIDRRYRYMTSIPYTPIKSDA